MAVVVVLSHEAKRLTEAWGWVMVSLCYCFCIGRLVGKGVKRLILMVPVMLLFFLVPLHLTTVHVIGTTGFFISWLANFKLSLFAFGKGPLSSSTIPLPIFLLVSCFPIKVQQLDDEPKPKQQSTREGSLFYLVKALLLLLLIQSFHYIHLLPDKAVLLLYGFNMYFSLDLILAVTASLVRATSSLELEPQFNEPYLATSLQDFWGKRWNLMVSEILRPTVYEPVLKLTVLPRKWASAPAALATFVVSGIMHELIFYYMGRLRPSWGMMSFFLLHGVCITAEIALKKAINRRWTSNASGSDSDHIIRIRHWCLVVLPGISKVRDRPKGLRGVRGGRHVFPEKRYRIPALGASFTCLYKSYIVNDTLDNRFIHRCMLIFN